MKNQTMIPSSSLLPTLAGSHSSRVLDSDISLFYLGMLKITPGASIFKACALSKSYNSSHGSNPVHCPAHFHTSWSILVNLEQAWPAVFNLKFADIAVIWLAQKFPIK